MDELLGHAAALDEEAQIHGQYYEDFLIPEILRGGWATAEDQRRDLGSRGLHGPWGQDGDDAGHAGSQDSGT